MEDFVTEHPRGRNGAVRYDLGVLGLDKQERREALAFYVDRFRVTTEEGER
jgi:hypothetical protein